MTVAKKKPRDRSAYYAEWYARNKERISEARRAKYAENPKVRRTAIKRAKAHYRNRKVNGLATDSMVIGGVVVYSTGHLATRLGVTPQTILSWERRGLLGTPAYTGPRAYTRAQARVAKSIAALIARVPRITPLDRRMASLLARWPDA